jgi:hypothetical protein
MSNEMNFVQEQLKVLSNPKTNGYERTLSDMTQEAVENLQTMVQDPDGPFAHDPELALNLVNSLAKAQVAVFESRRRLIDTVVKAKSVLSPTPAPQPIPEKPSPFNEVSEEELDSTLGHSNLV